MPVSSSTLVIGHRNPDVDSIASAIGYAWLLNQTGAGHYIAGRAGEINSQTAFALQKFGVEAPQFVDDIYPCLQDIAENVPSLTTDQTLLTASQRIALSHRPLALVENGIPLGLISGASIFNSISEALSSGSPEQIGVALNASVDTAVDRSTLILNVAETVRDVVAQALRAEPDDFILVDEIGHYVGLCRKVNLLAPPRQKIILVDHNEVSQAVTGFEEADLIEVLDHHRIGSIVTITPIRFQVEPVGSCSTLVYERAGQLGFTLPLEIAGLLLCGILSDTLAFRSPTTTTRDQRAAFALSSIAGVVTVELLGSELLTAGARLGSRSADEIVKGDLKFYDISRFKVGIVQVEVTAFNELELRQRELTDALQSLINTQGLDLALLLVTDVLNGNSRLITAGTPHLVAALPYSLLEEGVFDAPGVVSRKKQLLPDVTSALSQLA